MHKKLKCSRRPNLSYAKIKDIKFTFKISSLKLQVVILGIIIEVTSPFGEELILTRVPAGGGITFVSLNNAINSWSRISWHNSKRLVALKPL